jgi:hypothetical protein
MMFVSSTQKHKEDKKSTTRNIVYLINHNIITMRVGDVWQGTGDNWL